jgi:hypothetical protein
MRNLAPELTPLTSPSQHFRRSTLKPHFFKEWKYGQRERVQNGEGTERTRGYRTNGQRERVQNEPPEDRQSSNAVHTMHIITHLFIIIYIVCFTIPWNKI